MFAPPSWGLARQEHARSPTIRHCKWNFMSGFSWKKSVKEGFRRSNHERDDVPSASTAVMLDLSRNQSCIDLSADAQPNESIAIAPTLSGPSDADSDNSDSESSAQVTSDSEPEADQSATSSSISSISTAPEQGQLAVPKTTRRSPISTLYKERIHELPKPTETPLCVIRKTKTLEFDKDGEPYFKTSKGAINISSLPPAEQNAAYDHALTKIIPTNISKSGRARLPASCTRKVLEHYRLHSSRLAFTRSTIQDLALQHRTSGRLSYRCAMSSWRLGAWSDKEKYAAVDHLINTPRSFKARAAHEGEERGIMQLLDRCEEVLKHDPHFKPVPWRSPSPRMRWKEGRRGWMGTLQDDIDWETAKAERKGAATAKLRKAFADAGFKIKGGK